LTGEWETKAVAFLLSKALWFWAFLQWNSVCATGVQIAIQEKSDNSDFLMQKKGKWAYITELDEV